MQESGSEYFPIFEIEGKRISLRYPHLINISVLLGLANGPLIFLFYFYLAEKKYPPYAILHFIPFVIFLINQLFYYLQSPDFKFNSFVISRDLDLPLRIINPAFTSDPLGLRNLGGPLGRTGQ